MLLKFYIFIRVLYIMIKIIIHNLLHMLISSKRVLISEFKSGSRKFAIFGCSCVFRIIEVRFRLGSVRSRSQSLLNVAKLDFHSIVFHTIKYYYRSSFIFKHQLHQNIINFDDFDFY